MTVRDGTRPFDGSAKSRRLKVIRVSPEMIAALLQLPESTRPYEFFVDPWTRSLCLCVEDPAFAEVTEGAQLPSITPQYQGLTGCGHARFSGYVEGR